MKKTILTIGITILSCLLSFTNLQGELRWKNISKLSMRGKMNYIIDVKAFNGKCYVLYVDDGKHKYSVSANKGESWDNLLESKEIAVANGDYVGQIIDENNVIFHVSKNFMKTENGGANWHKVPVNGTIDNQPIENKKVQLFYMTMCDPKIGSAYGRYGEKLALYTTEDGWKNMEGNYVERESKIEGISGMVKFDYYLRLSKDTIIRYGCYNTPEKDIKIVISYSYDKGKTYPRHDTLNEVFYTPKPTMQCSPIKRCTAGFWTLSGGKVYPEEELNGRVYKCKNLGDKWEEIFFNEDYVPINNCDFYDENRGVVLGVMGEDPFRTYDGGKTWISDTLFTSEGKKEIGLNGYSVVYVGDTALILCGNYNGNVYRLEEYKSKEYDVDTLNQIKIAAKGDKFKNNTLTLIAFALAKYADECWIDLNDNKKREQDENLQVNIKGGQQKINEIFTNRKEITIYGNINKLRVLASDVEEISISKNKKLTSLMIMDNPLSKTDISQSESLASIDLLNCTDLYSLDLGKSTWMSDIDIKNCPITEIYMPKGEYLRNIRIENTKIKEIDISNINSKSLVILKNNLKLKKIITGDSCKVETIYISEPNDDVTTMDLSGLKVAKKIDIALTGFTELDLSECKGLEQLKVSNNPNLKEIKIPDADSLKIIDVSRNIINTLNFKPNKRLVVFNCNDNNDITSLNFSGNEKLEVVDCFRNQIKGDEADKLMESLPDRTGKEPEGRIRFTAYNSDGKYKVGNWAYAYSVEKAKAKNWSIQYYPQGNYKGTSSVSEGTMKVFNIYPNPADNILNIPEYETLITDIEIYNSSLDQVKILSPAAKIDISELPVGVYYIKLNYVMHKFVKK